MPVQGRQIAMLVGDVINFTHLIQKDSNRGLSILETYRQLLDKYVVGQGGQLAGDYFGKGCLAWFSDPDMAVRCAMSIQDEIALDEDFTLPIVIMAQEGSVHDYTKLEYELFNRIIESYRNESGVFVKKNFQQRLSYTAFSFSPVAFHKVNGFPSDDIVQVKERVAVKQTNKNLFKGAIIALLAIAIGLFLVNRLIPQKTEDQKLGLETVEKSIAVLPFADLSTAPGNFFADGVMEDILTNLAKLKGLKVISRTSSMQYKSTEKQIKEIAGELGVNYILEGSVRQVEDKVKITAQLIDALEDRHIWAQTYERDLKDIFEIQAEVSQKIAEALNQNISPEVLSAIAAQPTQNIESYNALLEGRYLISLRTKEALHESIKRLDYALELDRNYADAYAEKAHAQMLMANFNFLNASEASGMSELNALKAIQLDPVNEVAYAVLANLYADQYKWDQSEASFKIALDLNPNNAIANYWYSLLLRELERFEEAIQFGTKATELDPLYPVIHCGHALTCLMGGRADIAKSVLNNGRHLFDDFFSYHWVWGYYYLTLEQYNQAQDEFLKADQLNPDLHSVKRSLVYCWGKLGKDSQVEEYIITQQGSSKEDYLGLANAYAGMGNNQKCIVNLRKLRDIGELTTNIKSSIKFKHLIGDPAFERLINEMEHNEDNMKLSGKLTN